MKLFRLFLVLCLIGMFGVASAEHYTCNDSADGFVDLRGLDLIGRGSPNLKSLADADTATVWDTSGATSVRYEYIFDVDGTDVSNEPAVVRPTNWIGAGVWKLTGSTVNSLTVSGEVTGLVPSRNLGVCEGAQDDGASGDDALFLTDDGITVVADEYIGMTLYNTSDVSSCVIGDNTADSFYCVGYVAGTTSGLTGGTGNDWDDTDAWAVAPGPLQSGTLFYIDAATTILHPVIVDYYVGYFSAGANAVKVDPQADGMTINFSDDGTWTNPGAGDEVDGDGTLGDYIWIHNQSATEAFGMEMYGSFADGGAT